MFTFCSFSMRKNVSAQSSIYHQKFNRLFQTHSFCDQTYISAVQQNTVKTGGKLHISTAIPTNKIRGQPDHRQILFTH